MRGNSIVEQADDAVDVFVDRDRQQAFVRGDSRLSRRDISCRRAVFRQCVAGVLAAGVPPTFVSRNMKTEWSAEGKIWEQNSVKRAQIGATGRARWDS